DRSSDDHSRDVRQVRRDPAGASLLRSQGTAVPRTPGHQTTVHQVRPRAAHAHPAWQAIRIFPGGDPSAPRPLGRRQGPHQATRQDLRDRRIPPDGDEGSPRRSRQRHQGARGPARLGPQGAFQGDPGLRRL
ncbi:MAG: Transcriptional regulator, MerR family, partial [uncultured Rubellimicrobium sp.]